VGKEAAKEAAELAQLVELMHLVIAHDSLNSPWDSTPGSLLAARHCRKKKMGDGGDGSKEDIIDLLSNVLKSPHQIDLGVQI